MTARAGRQMLAAVERAYDLDLGARDWLTGLVGHFNGALGRELCVAIEYNCQAPVESWFIDWAAPGLGPSDETWVGLALKHPDLSRLASALLCPTDRLPPVTRLSELTGLSLGSSPFRHFAERFGFSDVLSFNASDGTRRGVYFGLTGVTTSSLLLDRARRVLPHVSAALRIRRGLAAEPEGDAALEGAPHGAEAVLDVDGHVRDGEVAPAGREALRRAVLARDRARSERGRADVDESLAAWSALVEGRWSLVDVFERGGKRWVVAVPNLPGVRDPRALPPVERAVFALLALGRSNKSIAFELGIAEGTVGGYVREIRRKLGVEALRAAASARTAYTSRFALGASELVAIVSDSLGARLPPGALSPEERVVALVLSGNSNEAVARQRGISPRTVANQLASAYRKLGVGSRRELRAVSILGYDAGDDGSAGG